MPNQRFTLALLLFLSAVSPLKAQNDKQVLGDAVFTPEEIAAGAEVTYLIRFQNFELDTANDIAIRDTLDPRLDAATFKMVDASHGYQLLRDQGFVRWYFDDIRLPSGSGDNPESSSSTGFVLFTVQPLPFLDPGQSIQNRACIIFDNQQPVCTNQATIWIDAGADAAEPEGGFRNDFQIVPNPNYGHFEVRKINPAPPASDDKVEWWISDMTGKTIWDGATREAVDAPTEVMLERPAPGLYMLWVKERGRLQVEQFAVIR